MTVRKELDNRPETAREGRETGADTGEAADIDAEMVVHKATRDCPMTEPHRRGICGIVQARERAGREADARRRGAAP